MSSRSMNPEHKEEFWTEEKKWDLMSLQTVLKTTGIHIKLLDVTYPLVIDVLINNRSLKNFQEWISFTYLLVKLQEHCKFHEKKNHFGQELRGNY